MEHKIRRNIAVSHGSWIESLGCHSVSGQCDFTTERFAYGVGTENTYTMTFVLGLLYQLWHFLRCLFTYLWRLLKRLFLYNLTTSKHKVSHWITKALKCPFTSDDQQYCIFTIMTTPKSIWNPLWCQSLSTNSVF